MQWHEQHNSRTMPWKGEKDAYKIWLSEIILQQTRVEQGLAYYEKFIIAYPTIIDLAAANDEEVFKLWEGLGYYTRCKNLLATARIVAFEKQGIFPTEYNEIIALKGIGAYTAAAIASFAFNLPYAVVDGNVYRVFARYFNLNTPIDAIEGKKMFQQLANNLLHKAQPALYNQAIMDFGATVCKPANPNCGHCILQKKCGAFANSTVTLLPIKEKKLLKKTRYFYFYILQYKNQVWVEKRLAGDIWENLYQFYLVEEQKPSLPTHATVEQFILSQLQVNCSHIDISAVYKQLLTHQTIVGQFVTVQLTEKPASLNSIGWKNKNQLPTLAFPKFINQYLQNKEMQLQIF
jgi:A/G-specific adenine glycosylase